MSQQCREAWRSHAGLSRTEAKRQYISTLIETMHRYATTTPEARELVSELEFVWDQIKSNSASPAGSSPGQQASSQQMHQQHRQSYAMRRQRDDDAGGLRALRPFSDGDEEEEGEEEEDVDGLLEAAHGPFNEEEAAATVPMRPLSRDLDVRNRKWRKRVEQALVQMTVEVAALREQLETQGNSHARRHNSIRAWILWLFWTSFRHLIIDAAVVGFLIIWARRRGDHKVEQGLQLLVSWVKEQLGKLKMPQAIKFGAKRS